MREAQVGILTGGGDVPGLNSVIKSVVYRASGIGREVVGICKGWKGLTHMDPSQKPDPRYIWKLNRENTRTIDRSGGTILHTSRTNPGNMKKSALPSHVSSGLEFQTGEDGYDLTPVVLDNLERLKIGILIVIGGDDTLSYAARLQREGFPVIGIPKTMDNDVQNTEYCIGFSTAITRAQRLITRQRTTVASHERIAVFRIFGRDSGFTALFTGYVSSSRCLIPEYTFELDRLCQLLVEDKRNNPSHYSLVVVSEGAVWVGQKVAEFGEVDAYGHRKKVDIGHALAQEIRQRTGEETMASDLTYDLRSGEPDSLDHLVATTFANIAMDLVGEGSSGRMLCVEKGCYGHTEIPDPTAGPRKVDVDKLYNVERYRPNYLKKVGSPMLLAYL